MKLDLPTNDPRLFRVFPCIEEGQRYLTLNGWEYIGSLKNCTNGTRLLYGNPDSDIAYVVLEASGEWFRATFLTT
jgi:hypothetical protein